MPIEIAVALPFILWIIFRISLPSGPFEMDHGNGAAKGTFFPILILYSALFYAIAGLGFYGSIWSWRFASSLWPAALFLLSGIYALLFNGLLVLFYESYMHTKYVGVQIILGQRIERTGPSNYTITKYAMILALGFSSVLLLIAGSAWTGLELGR